MKNLFQQVEGAKDNLQEQATAIGAAAQEKVNELLQEYKQIITLLQEIGIKVDTFQVNTGVGLPQISTVLSGSMNTIKKDDLQKLIESYEQNKLLGSILTPLLLVKNFQESSLSGLENVAINIQLGLPPKISINLS